MKLSRSTLGLTFTSLVVIIWAILFFLPKPLLLTGVSFSTAVYDNQHHLLRLTLSHDDQYRLFTPLADISPDLVATTLLQEDQYFWWHYGINPLSMLKAGWQTYVVHSRRMGASTITMQLARLRFGLHSKTLSGKIQQMVRAVQLEMHYSKRQILEAYLNLAPYGNNIEGVGAASLIYFNKPASRITLPEALSLSVIPQNPLQRTPRNEKLIAIRHKLFMRWLTLHPEDGAKDTLIDLPLDMRHLHDLPFVAPHFVNRVLNQPSSDSQEVQTTLDGHLQALLTRLTRQYIRRNNTLGAYNAAVLLVDVRDMSVKSEVGSVDFFNQRINGQINGTEIKRSPGSTLKPFIYGLALDQGLIHPNTVLKDVPHRFGGYNPENFDYDFMGPLKARDALVLSRNIPAIDLANRLANPNLYQFLEHAHISDLKPESYYGLALSLGGAELTMHELIGLYAMLVNDGLWHRLRMRKTDPMDTGVRMLSPEASFLIHDPRKRSCTDPSSLKIERSSLHQVMSKTILSRLRY